MQYAPAEWKLRFCERSSAFGADPSLADLAKAAEAALRLRGWNDPDTQTTVRKWQSAHGGLDVDGHYGPQSAKALALDLGRASPAPYFAKPGGAAAEPSAGPPPPVSAPPSAGASTTSSGAPAGGGSTANVRLLAQKTLALLLVKGWQDPATRAAVHTWQEAHAGIAADGGYGPESAAALAVDLGAPSPSPHYMPVPGAAHPSLLATFEAKASAAEKTVASYAKEHRSLAAGATVVLGLATAAYLGRQYFRPSLPPVLAPTGGL